MSPKDCLEYAERLLERAEDLNWSEQAEMAAVYVGAAHAYTKLAEVKMQYEQTL